MRNFKITIPVPIFGIGCGVLGMSLHKKSVDLGKYASTLLKALEYRGYDSTGGAFQNDKKEVVLLKDVGKPSTLVKTLGMENQEGKIFCGQVRWATFGSVTKKNAQPHEVNCKRHIYGAHNGNITNTRELKDFLLSEGHNVVSDNDGEMLVHTVEHFFDNELEKSSVKDQNKESIRREAMKSAIIRASDKMVGSYAAVIVDPVTEYSYAVKAGSSLYFGIGTIDGNKFGLASSDLTAVLRFTKNLVNMREGECVEYRNDEFNLFAFRRYKQKRANQKDIYIEAGDMIEKKPVRSKLRAEDTELLPEYDYFMEQEIAAEVESTRKLIKIFQGGSNTGRRMIELLKKEKMLKDLTTLCENILSSNKFEEQKAFFADFKDSDKSQKFYKKVKENYQSIYAELVKENFERKYFFSSDKNIFIELLNHRFDKTNMLISKAMDSIAELNDVKNFNKSVDDFLELLENTNNKKGTIYAIACGTSFHAAKTASIFFNEIANINIIPTLPGDYRGQFSKSLRDDDVIIGVSQSGETKDLIDIFNDVDSSGLDVKKIVLVNNMNSTLGQEKSDVSIPINCGPEIAVPATKSFMNQITLFYYLAIRLAQARLSKLGLNKDESKKAKENLENRLDSVSFIPDLIQATIDSTKEQVEFVARKIYMEPSMHILATKITGVAKEGALKIRETVLNHAEGGEASEFKHGPNTILGRNTVFGVKNVRSMLKKYIQIIDRIYKDGHNFEILYEERHKLTMAVTNYIFTQTKPFNLSKKGIQLFDMIIDEYNFFDSGYRNYPLIYITGPDERDVNLTISQINTHKIRGGDTFVIAEENDKLLENAKTNPHDEGYYGWGYITLPKTGDAMMTTFSSTVVLQLLALSMSIKKMKRLDSMGISEHGVHPDVPKNVSKSITVD
jgi:glucosamine 6-phosphate synthetase-like amidotransferase/phosphosugar isomerase protein